VLHLRFHEYVQRALEHGDGTSVVNCGRAVAGDDTATTFVERVERQDDERFDAE
jgi:hypothetical protein